MKIWQPLMGRMCIVPGCSSAYYPGCGIRFHLFPKAANKRDKWLICLNLKSSDYSKAAILCYLHFDSSDYCNKKSRLKPQALPRLNKKRRELNSGGNFERINVEKSLQGPDTYQPDDIKNVLTHVCKTCLATGCKMYSMKQYNLEQSYLLLSGIISDMFHEARMPQMICFECLQRLHNFIQFSTKSITAWSLLKELSEDNKLSIENIKKINREQNLLTSRLTFTNFEPNYFDVQVEEYEEDENDDAVDMKENLNESMNGVLDIDDIKQNNDIGESFEIEEDIEMNTGSNHYEKKRVKYEEMKHKEDFVDEFSEKYINKYNEMFIAKTMTPEEQKAEIEDKNKASNYQNAEFECHKCYKSFNHEEPYNEHMRKYSDLPDDAPNCPKCNIRFLDEAALRSHLTYSPDHGNVARNKPRKPQFARSWKIERKRFTCEQCSEDFVNYLSYAVHFGRAHPDKQRTQYLDNRPRTQFICDLCGKVYQKLATLNNHRQSHSGTTPYSCNICGKSFKTKMMLNTHKLDHTHALQCSECGKSFMHFTNLRRHMLLHTEKPYKCSSCGKRFVTPSDKRQHVTHSHMGVPWPRKRPGAPKRNRRAKSDVDKELTRAEQSIAED